MVAEQKVHDSQETRLAEAAAYAVWCDAAVEVLDQKSADVTSRLLARRVLKTVGEYLHAVASGQVFSE